MRRGVEHLSRPGNADRDQNRGRPVDGIELHPVLGFRDATCARVQLPPLRDTARPCRMRTLSGFALATRPSIVGIQSAGLTTSNQTQSCATSQLRPASGSIEAMTDYESGLSR
jgi:hypothetical protein